MLAAELLGVPAEDARARRLSRALPLGVRLRRSWALGGVAAAAGIAVLAGFLAVTGSSSDDPGVLVGQWRHEPSGQWRLFARQLTARDLAAGTLSLASLRRTGVVNWDRVGGDLRPGHPGTLLTARAFPDSGGEDLVLGTGQRYERLTWSAGDDYTGSWSPDGRWIAFSTDQWTAANQSAIGVMDPDHPEAVRRLSRGEVTRDVGPLWSADGSRIAFVRTHLLVPAPSEMCVVTVDGFRLTCRRVPGYQFQGLVGWASSSELVGRFLDANRVRPFLAVDLGTGAVRSIAEGEAGQRSHSPGWIACFCKRNADEPLQLLVFSATDPVRGVRLDPPAPPGNIEVFGTERRAKQLDHLKIVNAPEWIPADGSWQLGLQGWDGQGRPREPLAVRWRSSDTLTARVDTTGEVHPVRRGAVTIVATSGGWRTDSVTLEIREASTAALMSEDWRGAVERQWVPYGTPRPFVARTSRGPALAPNGDSTFWSGVYSRRLLPVRGGLGMELVASLPVSSTIYQTLELLFLTADSVTARGWDLVKGQLALPDQQWRSCAISYPDEVRRDRMALTSGSRSLVPVPARTFSGAWIRVRLQIFPDGRCGLAINGRPEAILDQAVPMGDSVMVLIGGFSYRTRFLVGPLEIWRGVRRDVDWSEVEGGRR